MDEKLLQLLIEQAGERRDQAAGAAAEARRQREAAAATLRTLADYREESLGRAPARAGTPVGMEQLRAAGQFDARLVAVIRQQHEVHAQRQAEASVRDASLADRQRRLTALNTLEERRALASSRREAKREQRALDEYATQLAARRRPGKDRP